MGNNTSNANTEPSETQDVEAPQTATVNQDESSETQDEATTTQPSFEDLQAQVRRLEAALSKANKDAKGHRLENVDLKKSHAELQAFKEQIEAEKLSTNEKQERERQKLEQQYAELQKTHENALRQSQERIVNYEVRLQAAKMGIVDPDAAAKLLDWSEIEYDDAGAPTNVEDLLNGLLKAKPYLKAQQSRTAPTSGGATNPPRSQSSAAQPLSWEAITQMATKDPEQYNRRRAEITQWMAHNPIR